MYIKKVFKTLLCDAGSGISLAYFLQYRSDVRNYYGIRGLQSGTWNAEIAFIGLENFRYMLQISDVRQAIANTVIIAVAKIIGNIIVPLTFAILLNELCLKKIKRPIQTIVYMPHFLSWVILAKIVLNIFWLYRTDQSDPGFFGQIRFSFSESRPVSTAGHRHRYLEELRL